MSVVIRRCSIKVAGGDVEDGIRGDGVSEVMFQWQLSQSPTFITYSSLPGQVARSEAVPTLSHQDQAWAEPHVDLRKNKCRCSRIQ